MVVGQAGGRRRRPKGHTEDQRSQAHEVAPWEANTNHVYLPSGGFWIGPAVRTATSSRSSRALFRFGISGWWLAAAPQGTVCVVFVKADQAEWSPGAEWRQDEIAPMRHRRQED